MLSTTGWVLKTWLKITIALALIVFGVWLFGTPGWLLVTLVLAGITEWWVTGALCREWVYEARFRWWWNH